MVNGGGMNVDIVGKMMMVGVFFFARREVERGIFYGWMKKV